MFLQSCDENKVENEKWKVWLNADINLVFVFRQSSTKTKVVFLAGFRNTLKMHTWKEINGVRSSRFNDEQALTSILKIQVGTRFESRRRNWNRLWRHLLKWQDLPGQARLEAMSGCWPMFQKLLKVILEIKRIKYCYIQQPKRAKIPLLIWSGIFRHRNRRWSVTQRSIKNLRIFKAQLSVFIVYRLNLIEVIISVSET